MIVNNERNMTPIGRRAEELPRLRARLRESLKREPGHKELAEKLGIKESDIPMVEAAERNPYALGGFRNYDVSDRTKPKLLAFQKTGGIGVHRFDMDENYAYISTEMEGYLGNILVIYDIRKPEKPQEVSRWWMPGQNLAAGEKPSWAGKRHRLHHALRFGDKLWAGCWHAGVRVIDISNIRAPRRAPVPGAHERHAGVLLLVRRRPAHRRRRRSAGAAGSRLFHPRAGPGKSRAADQRRRRRSARTDLHRRPLRWLRRAGVRPLGRIRCRLDGPHGEEHGLGLRPRRRGAQDHLDRSEAVARVELD